MKRQFCIGIAASILCLFQLSNIDKVNAQVGCQNVADGCLKINNNALTILLQDIVSSPETVQQTSDANINIQSSSLPTLSGTPPTVETHISRTIKNLWQLEVPSGSENNLVITYQYGNLSHQNSSVIQVQSVTPTDISVVGQGSTSDKVIVQGGATFNLILSNIKASGNYSGDLIIKVKVTSQPN
jgi:hypothetical protein